MARAATAGDVGDPSGPVALCEQAAIRRASAIPSMTRFAPNDAIVRVRSQEDTIQAIRGRSAAVRARAVVQELRRIQAARASPPECRTEKAKSSQRQLTDTTSTGSEMPLRVTVLGSEAEKPAVRVSLLARISPLSPIAAIRAASCTPLPLKSRPI